MDIDLGVVPTLKEDDLSQYNLEEYDDDVQTTSESIFSFLLTLISISLFSHGTIHQYKRSNILQRQ